MAIRKPIAFGKSLFDHYTDVGNVGTGEDDLYSDTIPALQLQTNGDKLEAIYSGITVASGTASRRWRLYFGGTAIFDSGDLYNPVSAGAWALNVSIIRVSSSVVRYSCALTISNAVFVSGSVAAVVASVGELTGLTLSNTQVLKITGEAASTGAATNDIVAKLGYVDYTPAA